MLLLELLIAVSCPLNENVSHNYCRKCPKFRKLPVAAHCRCGPANLLKYLGT